jgi:hypothetical protein
MGLEGLPFLRISQFRHRLILSASAGICCEGKDSNFYIHLKHGYIDS